MSDLWKLGAEGSALLKEIDGFATSVVAPAAPATDKEARFPTEAIRHLREKRLMGIISSKDVGGRGHGLRAAVATVERIARECPSTAMVVTMHHCATAVLEAFGSKELRRQIAEGGKLTTLAFSEAGSRSHFWIPVSTATPDGQNVKLNATKQLITSAGHADLYVWSSKPAAAPGLSSIYAVPATTPGLQVGAAYEGLGLRGNSSSPMTAKDATIPAANVLGEDGKGFDVMMGVVMPWFSFQNCAVQIGCMEGGFARAVQHVTHSKFGYDNSSLADLPMVRQHLAQARLKIDMVRGLLLDGLDAVENKREDAMLRVLQAKLAGAETSLEVSDLTLRVCGGAAYRKDVGVDRFFRDSRSAHVMAPVSDALYEFIGKAVCGMPVF